MLRKTLPALVGATILLNAQAAHALPETAAVYAAPLSTADFGGNVKQARLGADGALYMIGVSTSSMYKIAIGDSGLTATQLTYSPALAGAYSIVDFVTDGSRFFITTSGGTFRTYRYDLSGSTLTQAAVIVEDSGSATITYDLDGGVLTSRGTKVRPLDQNVVQYGNLTQTLVAPSRARTFSSGDYYYYSASGALRRASGVPYIDAGVWLDSAIPVPSGNDVLLNTFSSTDGGLPVAIEVTEGGYVYVPRAGAIRKVAPNGTILWSFPVSTNIVALAIGPTGKIYTVFGTSAFNVYWPITSPLTPSSTPDVTSAELTWNANASGSDYVGTTICRSTADYPTLPTEGTEVAADLLTGTFTDTGLTPGTQYYYTLFNKTADGFYGAGTPLTTTTTTDTTPPSAPTLAAVATGNNVALSWDVPSTTSTFALRRSTIAYPTSITDGLSVLAAAGAEVTSKSDNALADGTYYYSLFALDEYSNASTAGQATVTIDTTPPSAPTSFAATVSGNSINLAWTNPTTDFSHVIIRASQEGYPSSPSDGISLTMSSSASSFEHSSLMDSTYYYSVFAVDAYGNISTAAQAYATVDTTAPDAPTATATPSGSDIQLDWTAPSGASSVVICRGTSDYPSGVACTTPLTMLSSQTSYTDEDLADGTYYYSFFAVDDAENISTAGHASATVDTTPTSAPSSFEAVASGTSIALSWVNPTDGDFASVTIRRGTSSAPTSIADGDAVLTDSTSTSTYDLDLTTGTTYRYAIFAKDSRGNVSSSATAVATVCSTCPSGEHEVTECTSTTDTVCAPNVDGGVSTVDAGEDDASVDLDAEPFIDATMSFDAESLIDATIPVFADVGPVGDAFVAADAFMSIDAHVFIDAAANTAADAHSDEDMTIVTPIDMTVVTPMDMTVVVHGDADTHDSAAVLDAPSADGGDDLRGGGGCSTSGTRNSASQSLLLALAGVLALTRRRRRHA